MSGGNRAYTLQDVIGQLNTDSAQGQTTDVAVQINVLTAVPDVVTAHDAATLTAGPTSFDWGASGATWGSAAWLFILDGDSAHGVFADANIDGGNASSVYPGPLDFEGGGASE